MVLSVKMPHEFFFINWTHWQETWYITRASRWNSELYASKWTCVIQQHYFINKSMLSSLIFRCRSNIFWFNSSVVLTETCLASWSSCGEILTELVVSTRIRAFVRCWRSLCLFVNCCESIKVFKCQWLQHNVSSSWSEVVLMSHVKTYVAATTEFGCKFKLISVSHTSRQ